VFAIGSNFADLEPVITPKTKIDLFAADTSLEIGNPPNEADRLDGPGVNTRAITRALLALGAKREFVGGRSILAIGAEHSVHLSGPLASGSLAAVGVLNHLDRSFAQGHTFASGPAVAPVLAILGGGRSLASDPRYEAAATCLGDVVAAEIVQNTLNPSNGTQLIAIGDRRPASSSAPITEVLCAVDSAASQADAQVARLRSSLGPSGRIPSTQTPGPTESASRIVSSVTVGRADHNGIPVARAVITMRSNVGAGYLNRLLQTNQIVGLIGS
jgi:hypothetical protein